MNVNNAACLRAGVCEKEFTGATQNTCLILF